MAAEPSTAGPEPILRVEGLVKHYSASARAGGNTRRTRRASTVCAVDGVSFSLRAGEALGLVGESGCGKSTLAMTLLRLTEPTGGQAFYRGQDIFAMSRKELRDFRRRMQIVFQDPFESLNPRMTVGQIIAEPWSIHRDAVPKGSRRQRVAELLEMVGLRPEYLNRFPAQFSGGQRQRIGIARAIALNPEVLICDEPVSALDVSVQAQVVNLLGEIQRELGLAYIFIGHDLGVVRHVADTVAVMYMGRIVEYGAESEVFGHPQHPYTRALLSAVPVPRNRRTVQGRRIVLSGEPPSPVDPPSGCRFRTRCWLAVEMCAAQEPDLAGHGRPDHRVACHRAEDTDPVTVESVP